MTMAEIKGSAVIFYLLFMIIGVSGIILAISSDYSWQGRLFSGIIGTILIAISVIGLKILKSS